MDALLQQAEAGDTAPGPGLQVADDGALRHARWQQLSDVQAALAARAQARSEQERAAYEAPLAQRRAQEPARGRTGGGRPPTPPEPGPQGQEPGTVTDPESRLMPVSGGGVEHAYNAQLGVEHGRRRRVDNPVSQHPTDTQELPPAGAGLQQLPEPRGQVNHLLADTGYCREANGTAWEPAAIIPLLATGRTVHHPTPAERCADPGAAPNPTDPVGRMEHRVQPPAGKAL